MTHAEENEQMFDELIAAAFCRRAEQELDAVVWQPLPKHVFSPAHNTRMHTVLWRSRWERRLRRASRVVRRAAVVAAITLTVVLGGLMTVRAVREQVVRIVTEWLERFTQVSFEGGADSGEDLSQSGMMLPRYLPEGFEQTMIDRSAGSVLAAYQNAHGAMIVYEQLLHDTNDSAMLDNERHTLFAVTVNGQKGLLAVPNEPETRSVMLTWHEGAYTFSIVAETDEETVFAIAESVQSVD